MRGTFVIVGAGLAGATAAGALRTRGFTGRIVLIGAEPEFPYDRLALSKDYLKDRSEKAKLYLHPQRWYADHDIELRLDSVVTGIDRIAHEVVLNSGERNSADTINAETINAERIGYDKLLLATGAAPRRLDLPGAQSKGVLYLRNIRDCEAMKAAFATARHVAIIGAGWIGMESAVAARLAGCEVTVLGAGELPLVTVLGREVAQLYADLHRRHGVRFRLGVTATRITADGGRVTGVRLDDGSLVRADVVVVAIGTTPNTALAEAAGLDTDGGVVVDEHLATADPDVFAAGDAARSYYPHLGVHLRLGHWSAGRKQPLVAAAGMLGQVSVYDRVPYFFSDQFELGMEYLGYVPRGTVAEVLVRGDVGTGRFLVFWLASGRVLAGMNVNIWHLTGAIRALVSSGGRIDRAKLTDPAVPLDEVFV